MEELLMCPRVDVEWLLHCSDTEMRDGDAARELAKKWLHQNQVEKQEAATKLINDRLAERFPNNNFRASFIGGLSAGSQVHFDWAGYNNPTDAEIKEAIEGIELPDGLKVACIGEEKTPLEQKLVSKIRRYLAKGLGNGTVWGWPEILFEPTIDPSGWSACVSLLGAEFSSSGQTIEETQKKLYDLIPE